jgi:hypothetical protein
VYTDALDGQDSFGLYGRSSRRNNNKKGLAMDTMDFRMCECKHQWCKRGILIVSPKWAEMHEDRKSARNGVIYHFKAKRVTKKRANEVIVKINRSPMDGTPIKPIK